LKSNKSKRRFIRPELLIAPEGIEILDMFFLTMSFIILLIAPEGIEISYKLLFLVYWLKLLIAPEGIEIYYFIR